MKNMKLSQLRRKRLIIRNLSFKVNEEELKKIFSKFGEILDVKIPLKPDGKKKGFAFVEFNDTKSMIKAMKELNFQKIHGRPVAIDFALNKDAYLSRFSDPKKSLKQNIQQKTEDSGDDKSETTESSEGRPVAIDFALNNDAFLSGFFDPKKSLKQKTEDSGDDESETAESSEDDDEDYSEESENSCTGSKPFKRKHEDYSKEHENSSTGSKPLKKKKSEDVCEGKTVFIRNISFRNKEEDLREIVEEFGDIVYCLFCNDPVTDHFRGSAFVKFKEKENADKIIEESSKEPGILLDGRKLLCASAMSQEELMKQRDGFEKNKDKRNLFKCGLIAYGSKESGVCKADIPKKYQSNCIFKNNWRPVM